MGSRWRRGKEAGEGKAGPGPIPWPPGLGTLGPSSAPHPRSVKLVPEGLECPKAASRLTSGRLGLPTLHSELTAALTVLRVRVAGAREGTEKDCRYVGFPLKNLRDLPLPSKGQ